MTRGVLLLRAYVDEIHGLFLAAVHHAHQARHVQKRHAVLGRQSRRIRFGRRHPLGRGLGKLHPIGTAFELMAGQQPTRGPVLQPVDVRHAHALQRPRADDAARAACAVHDDRRVLLEVLRDVGDA